MGRIGPVFPKSGLSSIHYKEEPMKGLSAVLLCIMLATVAVGCGQDKGKATTQKKATTTAQSQAPKEKKASTKAQKKAPKVAQKKQQDRTGECNKQANLKNMKGEDRKRFMSSCLGGRA
jgi:uncharacterized protein HemX